MKGSFVSEKAEKKETTVAKLKESFEKGSVIGIFLKGENHKMYLTAVDEMVDDNLVMVKELDLQGIFHEDRRVAIDAIERIQCFSALYEDRLALVIKNFMGDMEDAQTVKIRTRERSVQRGDLKIILIKSIDTGSRINIILDKGTRIANCYIRDFSPADNKISFSQDIDDKKLRTVSLNSVAKLEFETFFYYRGLLSKVFSIDKE